MSQDNCLCLQTFVAVISGGYAVVGGGNADGCCRSCGDGGGDGVDGGGVFGRGELAILVVIGVLLWIE